MNASRLGVIDRMVHPLEKKALQVGNVARYVKGENLSRAASRVLVTAGKATEDQNRLCRRTSIAHDLLVSVHVPRNHWEVCYRTPLLFGEGRDALELANEVSFGWWCVRTHLTLPKQSRERQRSLGHRRAGEESR
jgi:hypothetical protein